MEAKEVLESARRILVIDWPSKDVPESLARAGFDVIVKGGPDPEDYSVYEVKDGQVGQRRTSRAPDSANLIYSYRPLVELPEIVALAKAIGAKTIWTQSGLSGPGINDPKGCWLPQEEARSARRLIEDAGLAHITAPYIGAVAREFQQVR